MIRNTSPYRTCQIKRCVPLREKQENAKIEKQCLALHKVNIDNHRYYWCESYLMDQYIFWKAHIVQHLELIPLQLVSSLGEAGEFISAAEIQSQSAAGKEARKQHWLSTLSPLFLLIQCVHAHTHRRPRLLQVCLGLILAAALRANNEFFKVLDFPHKNKSVFFFFFYLPSKPGAITLSVMWIWRTHSSSSKPGSSLLVQLIKHLTMNKGSLVKQGTDWHSETINSP